MNKYDCVQNNNCFSCMFSDIDIEFGLEHDHDELTRLKIN